jgi:hypothetical protein
MYAQCHLTRTDAEGTVWDTVGFIPAKFAAVGKRLRLTIGATEREWMVAGASRELYAGSLLDQQSRDHKRMRKASDI